MHKTILLFCLVATSCLAEDFAFPPAVTQDDAALAQTMSALAGRLIDAWQEADRARYLDTLFRLQIAARRYSEAGKTLQALRTLHADDADPQARATLVPYELFVAASLSQSGGSSFEQKFQQAFRQSLPKLEDRTSALALRALTAVSPWDGSVGPQLRGALDRQKGKTSLALSDAVELVRAYALNEVYRSFAAVVPALVDEDDNRRYIIERDVIVTTPDGAHVCAFVVRPRALATTRLPALLNFTIYVDAFANMREARRTASNGYVGVEGFTRGKACSPDEPVPFEHDGTDAAALIDWIATQSWSDGRVGMYGGSYEGFTQWATAKHMPRALKALMPSVTVAAGLDIPLDGGIFENFVYPWPIYTTTNKTLDTQRYFDAARWSRVRREWYVSGRAYRDMDKIDGTPNPFWRRWLDHPVYDSYWQQQIPFKKEFARIDIPVLTTTGYFDGGQIGALYYFGEHYKYRPNARHYFLIGPYDHFTGQRGVFNGLGDPLPIVDGYRMDPVAWIDIVKLRYEWFDHVFKGAPRPALLQDKVNYQVMGANVWKHAPSVAAMGAQSRKFHLSATRSGTDAYELSAAAAPREFVAQTVDFADRSDADRVAPGGDAVDREIDTANGLKFVSQPFATATELSGLFSAHLDFEVNKKDFDFNVQLYELTPANEYVRLSYYWSRASYVGDRSRRKLLKPNVRQRLDITARRLISRQFQAGSRLVLVLSVNKNADMQINYGTGKDVSDETIADAGTPLRIKWFGDSSLSIPIAPGR